MNKFDILKAFFIDYLQFYQKHETFEIEKLNALLSNELSQIEANILAQQVQAKKMEAMEQRREAVVTSLGLSNLTFNQIILQFEGNQKQQLSDMYQSLSDVLQNIQYYNRKSMDLIKMNLRLFEPSEKIVSNEYSAHQGSR